MKARYIPLIAMSTLIGAGFAGNAALALTEQSEAALEFTFSPSLTLAVSDSDLIIDNLIPGTSDISNTVDVTVTTNSVAGYSLFATTGNTTYPTRNLVKDNNNYLESIATDASIATLADNTWGYTLNNGSTYSGLPLYTATAKEINSSSSPVNATTGKTSFAIGAKAATTKASGNYNNVVNFTAVAKIYVPPTIQEVTTANCPTTATVVYDSRITDHMPTNNQYYSAYHIQKLADGKCWMLDNLVVDLTNSTVLNGMTEANTNASNATLNYLKNGGGTTSDKYATSSVTNWSTFAGTDGNKASYSEPLVYADALFLSNPNDVPANGAGYNVTGIMYNYCAASAGSYCYGDGAELGSSSGNATEDICPKGWRMPTGGPSGEYAALANVIYGSTDFTSDVTQINNYRNALSIYLSGSVMGSFGMMSSGGGYFWTSTRYGDSIMYNLGVTTSKVNPSGISGTRGDGYSIRCVAK